MDGSGGARVVLTVASPSEIEVRCNVPELGQGRDETVLRVLRQITGLDAEVFTFPWGDASVGAAALAQAPVERAGRAAAEALMAEGGALEGLVGRVFVGEDPDRAAPGWSAQVAVLDEAGAVRDLHVAVAIGEEQDARLAARLAEGASHMGAGVALSEEVEVRDGLPETRLRMLGVLKPKGSPRIHAIPVAIPGGPRDVSEVAVVPTAGAIANAVSAFEGSDRVALPMRDSAAAKHAGARQARG
jgi:CO/xanthine dehydrogenase Mo-binding subunit